MSNQSTSNLNQQKEQNMQVLIQELFNYANDEPGIYLPVEELTEKMNTKVKHVPDPRNQKCKIPLEIEKQCLFSHANVDVKGLRRIHIPQDYKNEDKWKAILYGFLQKENLISFGRPKGDGKKYSLYALPKEKVTTLINYNGSDIAAYTDIGLSDAPFSKEADVLVLKDNNELAEYIGYDPKIDGTIYTRPGFWQGADRQIRLCPKDHNNQNIALGKGMCDGKRFRYIWEDLFGEYDMVVIKDHIIKTNPQNAHSGKWIIAGTYVTDRPNLYPFHWEITQFMEHNQEVERFLINSTSKALHKLKRKLSTKEGIIRFVKESVLKKKQKGEQVVLDIKLLLVLTSKLPADFKWTISQLKRMILSEVIDIIVSYGLKGRSQKLYTDSRRYKSDTTYLSPEITRKLGGDNDGDEVVYAVNKELGLKMYWRFPVISGAVIEEIPEQRLDKEKDHLPELVELWNKYGRSLQVSRNDIKQEKMNVQPEEANRLNLELMTGAKIGSNTNNLKRIMTKYYEEEKSEQMLEKAKQVALAIEAGAVGLKKNVVGIKDIRIDDELYDKYPLDFTKIRDISSWKELSKVEIKDGSMEGRIYKKNIDTALNIFYKNWYGVETSSLVSKIDLSDIEEYPDEIMAKVEKYQELWNDGIAQYLQLKRAGKKEEAEAVISANVRMAEELGDSLKDDELRFACFKVFTNAGNGNTGAFAVHLANSRIWQVFGINHKFIDLNKTKININKSHERVIKIRCWSKAEIYNLEGKVELVKEGIQLGDTLLNVGEKQYIPNDINTFKPVDVHYYGNSTNSVIIVFKREL